MFNKIELKYDFKDLEPNIDEETMYTHYNKHYNRGTSKFRQQRNFQNINNSAAGDTPTLVFSKENLVRGLIAKEYLNKKYGGRK